MSVAPLEATNSDRGAACRSIFARSAARITFIFTSSQSGRISSGRVRCSVLPMRAASSGAPAARMRSIPSFATGLSTPLNFCAW